nr:MAG TPA: hypothetical protein [Bacteriophage sp.]
MIYIINRLYFCSIYNYRIVQLIICYNVYIFSSSRYSYILKLLLSISVKFSTSNSIIIYHNFIICTTL